MTSFKRSAKKAIQGHQGMRHHISKIKPARQCKERYHNWEYTSNPKSIYKEHDNET